MLKEENSIRDQVTDLFQHKYVTDVFIGQKVVRSKQFHTVQLYIKCKRKLFLLMTNQCSNLYEKHKLFILYDRY